MNPPLQTNLCPAATASEELARAFSPAGETRRVAGGGRLFSCGEPSQGVFLVVKGAARATLPGAPGRELVSRMAGPGAVLGLPSALCATRYQFDVEALEPVEVIFVETAVVNQILRQHTELCLWVMQMMCNELSALGEKREHMRSCAKESCSLHGACTGMD